MSTMMEMLNQKIQEKHLLKHPFYVAWARGELTLDQLRFYSSQYFTQVREFPLYLSEMHSRCQDLEWRKVIARNLAEEEGGQRSHPELWLDFAKALGVSQEEALGAQPLPEVQAMVDTFHEIARGDTTLAAVALYCYEKQVPAVSQSKTAGLKEHYQLTNPSATHYFTLHEAVDIEHAAEWEKLIQQGCQDTEAAAATADRVLDALWNGLSGIYSQVS